MKPEFDKEKFKEMILYISEKCNNNPKFGKTHLFKILHYSDLLWFGHTGKPISGESYIRWDHGQIPKHFDEAQKELHKSGILEIEEIPYYDRVQCKPIIKKKSVKYKKLSRKERNFMDTIIDQLVERNATDVSRIAHDDLFWQILENGEVIPYESVFFRRKNPISKETMEWAINSANEYEERMKKNGDAVHS